MDYIKEERRINRQKGAAKRSAKSIAKKLIYNYIEYGICENYGQTELNAIKNKYGSIKGCEYMDNARLMQEIESFIEGIVDTLWNRGNGNTRDKRERLQLSEIALNQVKNKQWRSNARY